MKSLLLSTLTFWLLTVTIYCEAMPIGPSFNCTKATTATEKEICSNPRLAEADLFLAEIYKLQLSQYPASKLASTTSQKRWLSEVRDKLCPANDFSWTKQTIDRFYDDNPLLKCYEIRITELRSKIVLEENFINRWKKMLRDTDYYKSYFYFPPENHNITPSLAEDFYFDKVTSNKIRFYGHECEGERYYMYYADDKFIRFASAKPNCEQHLPPDNFTNLCLTGKRWTPVTSYWACHEKNTIPSALSEIEQRISQGILEKIIITEGGKTPTRPGDFIWGSTQNPALVYNDPMFYTPETIAWAIEHKHLFTPILSKYKPILQLATKQLLIEREHILNQPNWQLKLASMTGSPIGNSEIIPPTYDMSQWSGEHLSNIQYSLHDFYLQIWARLYQNGGMDKALEAIDTFNTELKAL